MTELSSREHEFLDMILYLRHQLHNLLPEDQSNKLDAFLASQLDNYEDPLTPELVTMLLKEIRKYESVRARLEQLTGIHLLFYDSPAQPPDEGPIIPLGVMVVCPKKEGHDGHDPYFTRLRKQGQRCPIHHVFLAQLEA